MIVLLGVDTLLLDGVDMDEEGGDDDVDGQPPKAKSSIIADDDGGVSGSGFDVER